MLISAAAMNSPEKYDDQQRDKVERDAEEETEHECYALLAALVDWTKRDHIFVARLGSGGLGADRGVAGNSIVGIALAFLRLITQKRTSLARTTRVCKTGFDV